LTIFESLLGEPIPEVARIAVNDRLAALGEPPMVDPLVFALAFSPGDDRLAIGTLSRPRERAEAGYGQRAGRVR
jgi:hypothetical protein